MPKALVTRPSGTKKKARCVSLVTVSASLIALALSTMLMVDMKTWKVLSSLRLVLSRSRSRLRSRVGRLGHRPDFSTLALGHCGIASNCDPRSRIEFLVWKRRFLHRPSRSLQVSTSRERMLSWERESSMWSNPSFMVETTLRSSSRIISSKISLVALSTSPPRRLSEHHLCSLPRNLSRHRLWSTNTLVVLVSSGPSESDQNSYFFSVTLWKRGGSKSTMTEDEAC